MVEYDEAGVKADVAIRQLKVVDGAAREARLDEIFQVVAPVAERATERERQVGFVQNLVAGHEGIEEMPGVAELKLHRSAKHCFAGIGVGTGGAMLRAPLDFAAGAAGAEGEKRSGDDERISRRRRIEARAPQQHQAGLAGELRRQRLGRVRGWDFVDEGGHLGGSVQIGCANIRQAFSPSPAVRAMLLSIAQRHIRVLYGQKSREQGVLNSVEVADRVMSAGLR